MSRKLLPSISSMNSTNMANLNRMTLLMSISEITPQLFLAGQMAATVEQVQKLGITYILNVAVESSPIVYPKGIKVEKFDIIDFPTAPISNFFNSLTDKIHGHLNTNKQNKVLVHCMAGISRSTTIVCAYLMRYMNMTLREAYLLCKKHRAICFPNLGFWNQLITYENQLKKDISVKMIPTQFGNVPDVAYEEIKQLRAQQPFGSIPLSTTSLSSTINNSINSSNTNTDTISNQTRTTVRDTSINHSNAVVRSRSLNSNNRPTIAPSSTYINNSVYQTPLYTTNKQTFLTPARFGLHRSFTNGASHNNSLLPPAQSTSSTSYVSNRILPTTIKHRHMNNNNNNNNRNHPSTVTISAVGTTINNDEQRSVYETTYRASFFKPLDP
ncbi:unnamed protein product [Rotaria sp. Silwood1]|nr:unnamed protein product [Rotaria sp. Silwood1]CAF1607735.1 unnamed protein product [Rotaria sp. Silwood1]CAF4678759.1 unnamed protein product [Rotaria sp. Silwood1]CAF4878934.1 unnamed protein product [Rotaria sp. Silwood1]